MPPRHAYWTILIGDSPTAFRAREREELLPTFERLRAKQPDAVLKWFERGRLWASPEEARGPAPSPTGPQDRRGKEWRPGGAHRDPRDRFKKDKKPGARGHDDRGGPPPTDRPRADRPRDERPRDDRGPGAPRRPWQPKTDPRAHAPGGRRTDRSPVATQARSGAWRQAVAAKTARQWTVRPAVAAQAPGQRAGRPALAAKAVGRSGRPTVAVKADRFGRAASVEAEAAVRRSGTRTGPCGQAAVAAQAGVAPTNVPGRRSQKAAIDRGGPSPLGIAATSHGGPSLPAASPTGRGGPSLRATAPKNPGGPSLGGPRREAVAAQARSRDLATSPGGPSRMERVGGTRPPREKEDQGPPNDRSPREERGRKGGTRLVKKVRR